MKQPTIEPAVLSLVRILRTERRPQSFNPFVAPATKTLFEWQFVLGEIHQRVAFDEYWNLGCGLQVSFGLWDRLRIWAGKRGRVAGLQWRWCADKQRYAVGIVPSGTDLKAPVAESEPNLLFADQKSLISCKIYRDVDRYWITIHCAGEPDGLRLPLPENLRVIQEIPFQLHPENLATASFEIEIKKRNK